MVHDAAATGYQRESATYAAVRPAYHPHVVDVVAAVIGNGLVIDLGAGTGIATAMLADRGLDVVAVEPVQAMRQTLTEQVPAARVVDGTAESIPMPTGSATAVVVAQAFHWFDHGPTLDEIARVITDGGTLVTLWNVRDESVPWMAAYTTIQDQVQGDAPRYRTMKWRRAIEADERFTLVDEVQALNPQQSNAEHTIGRFLSTSFIASLDPERQGELVEQIREVVAHLGPEFNFPYLTEAQIWSGL